jgi:hypothetical protein
MNIKHVFDFNKALDIGPYAWPGGYPHYFLCNDCEALSFAAAQENAALIRDAIITRDKHSGWFVIAMDINWEDNELTCAHSNEKIQSAYGSDDSSLEHCDACNETLEPSQIGKCDSCQKDG